MRSKLRKKTIIIAFGFLVFTACVGLLIIANQEREFDSKDSEASEEVGINIDVYPNIPTSDEVTAIVVEVDNLSQDASNIEVLLDGTELLNEPLYVIEKMPYTIGHVVNSQDLDTIDTLQGIITNPRFTSSSLGRMHNRDLETYTDLNIKNFSSKEELIEKTKEHASADVRTINGKTICGVGAIILDEPITVLDECEDYICQKEVEILVDYIIDMQQAIKDVSATAECESETELGIVEWKKELLIPILEKLDERSRVDGIDNAFISFIQTEDYGWPWASAWVETPPQEMLEIAEKYGLEYHIWGIGTGPMLALSQYADKVVLTDSWGRWGVNNDVLPSRFRDNLCYEPCVYSEDINKCCPYFSVYQQKINVLSNQISNNDSPAFHLVEQLFDSGVHTVDIKIFDDSNSLIKTKSFEITVDGETEFCQPSCENKECGSDGCVGTCGVCLFGSTCSAEGLCGPGQSVDLSGDNEIALEDYQVFIDDYKKYKETGEVNVRSDINRDDKINLRDYERFITIYKDSKR
jgi:hypothetical protein